MLLLENRVVKCRSFVVPFRNEWVCDNLPSLKVLGKSAAGEIGKLDVKMAITA
jgi:hypothetical protein